MNCLIVDDDEFSRNVIKHFVNKTDGLTVLEETDNAADAFTVIKTKEIDIVFLDVEMPEMTGLDLMKTLDDMPQIILVTSRASYAVEAFEHNVTDYLVKPVNYARFLKAVGKAEANLKASN
ncbi:MAG: DNA-binding response regulator, partial [Flavobacteriaceae bacterium CG_4_9_14_3_um_filter_33_16]